jgi:hypothetical protein
MVDFVYASATRPPYPHSMRLRMCVWPGLAWLLHRLYAFMVSKPPHSSRAKEHLIVGKEICFFLFHLFILLNFPSYFAKHIIIRLVGAGWGKAQPIITCTRGSKGAQWAKGGKGPKESLGTGAVCICTPRVHSKRTAASFNF